MSRASERLGIPGAGVKHPEISLGAEGPGAGGGRDGDLGEQECVPGSLSSDTGWGGWRGQDQDTPPTPPIPAQTRHHHVATALPSVFMNGEPLRPMRLRGL